MIDVSVLLLDTPYKPTSWEPPTGAGPAGRPGVDGVAPGAVGLADIPAIRGTKSSLAIGSFHFFRRKCRDTSTSASAGNVQLSFTKYSAIARAYCWPRNTRSASRCRTACWRHAGSIVANQIAVTAMATSNATSTKPPSSDGEPPLLDRLSPAKPVNSMNA